MNHYRIVLKELKHMTRLLFSMALLVSTLHAGITGKIAGNVTDSVTGETLAGANIYIPGTSFGAATDVDGNFVIIGIPPGKYEVLANYISYQDKHFTDIRVNIDKTTLLEVSLNPETLESSEEIVVVA